MKKLFVLIFAVAAALASRAEITPTDCGAKITLDSITTELIVYAPGAVRVIKYVGEHPELPKLKVKGLPSAPAKKAYRSEGGHNKLKIDTGDIYAALNEKDANVSFWNHGDTLIMAEQHKTGVIGAPDRKGRRAVAQDFQMGRAKVENLKFAKNRISTEKGFGILWLADKNVKLDDSPREDKKKQGDVTLASPSALMIDYLFVIE